MAAFVAIGACIYVVVYPFSVVRYPPMTDLPFHASDISIYRHYWDPAFGFQQQFTLHPFEVPYMSMYAIGALFALVLPMNVAVKASAIVMLGLLPAGLSVLFSGMKKSPLWGVLGLGAVWMHLTHWGFLNFVGAIGLFAMCVGFALLIVDRPTRGRQLGLALGLIAIFFTHLFRLPFALLAVFGTAICVWPATRRLWPAVWPTIPSILLYAVWHFMPKQAHIDVAANLKWSPERMGEIPSYLVDGFGGTAGALERGYFNDFVAAALVLGLSSSFWFVFQGRLRGRSFREWWWGISVTVLPALFALGFLFAYLVLPMRIGLWWYVYPREVTPALFILFAAVPDMPKAGWYRLPLVVALAVFSGRTGYHVAQQYYAFEQNTRDFQEIVREIPKAPRLAYLVFNHDGSTRAVTPFIHLPAWVQAEKGGALSFHFIGWNHNPIAYRDGSPNVPPKVPERWEWQPNWFDVRKNGAWFDWFLVRRYGNPAGIFSADPSIHLVGQRGSWWLFRRVERPAG
ncbi:MAG: hypothetical protein IPI67_05370 [Myxococcales bacterium]|nr:hypothetical protein [Myxococcales bacterium]